MQQEIILASKSPRRAELLQSAGVPFRVVVADIEERNRETAEATVLELAKQKANKVKASFTEEIILAADTVVATKNGEILGKPESEAEAESFLSLLSGDWHYVHSGFCLTGRAEVNQIVSTKVFMRDLSSDQIKFYVKTGEPMDKAGAYGIQGRAASFILRIEGSYTGVVGLPLAEVLIALENVTS